MPLFIYILNTLPTVMCQAFHKSVVYLMKFNTVLVGLVRGVPATTVVVCCFVSFRVVVMKVLL